MDSFIIKGGTPLQGEITVAGAKNVALKIMIASLLTEEDIIIHNVPHIRDVFGLLDVLHSLGVTSKIDDKTIVMSSKYVDKTIVPLDLGARFRTSSMVLGPLLARFGKATVPNPGGCRLGARPIDRHIQGLQSMGAAIDYDSADGYFHAIAPGLHGTRINFNKNTHTGTETMILAAVLAKGETVIENAAEEIEIDDLIGLLTIMGAKIRRTKPREITIMGVETLHGGEYTIMPDRNEEITFALMAAMTHGEIMVHQSQRKHIQAFLDVYTQSGGKYEVIDDRTTKYFGSSEYHSTHIATASYPGFMTDWQAPWAVFMTQAQGVSTIHETVFESRFSYVHELEKMGAKITFFSPEVKDPEKYYNFNWSDRQAGSHQGIEISGPTRLHNAVLHVDDIRAGASLVLAALSAEGESYLHGVELIDRGYEHLEQRLRQIGANIVRQKEE